MWLPSSGTATLTQSDIAVNSGHLPRLTLLVSLEVSPRTSFITDISQNTVAIDHATRKRIRSHAATGRNAGKSLVRASRKSECAPPISSAANLSRIPDMVWNAYELERNRQAIPEIERQVGDGLCFPVKLGPGSRHLAKKGIHHPYCNAVVAFFLKTFIDSHEKPVFSFMNGPRHAPELSNCLDFPGGFTGSIWIQYMFWDEAYFHCAVATSIMAINTLATNQEITTEVLRHLSHTFRLINERLAGADTVSDETIAAVVGMAQYERQQGNFDRGLIHVGGLQRMTELRGGISRLVEHKSSLAQKIFRVDLDYSLQLGSKPLFSLEDAEACSAALGHDRNIWRRRGQSNFSDFDPGLSALLIKDLQVLFDDMRGLSRLLNNSSARNGPKVDGYALHDLLIQLGYHLLSISPLINSGLTKQLDVIVHLGLAAFLVTFLRGLDRRITGNPLLYKLIRSIAHQHNVEDQESQEALLWALLVGESSIFTEHDDIWLVPKLKSASQALDLRTWGDVAQILAKFPWVDDMHSMASKGVWNKLSPSLGSQVSQVANGNDYEACKNV
ncbi:hypothetical protein AK830_g3627 [Neonectria ditissima]|uniref:Transcription factor domain-containing protein n=1 Tax=Neonectria ditissima TaxID=78410 RepID=A0A0P7AYA2_9HYPO|nr:hypothetical protein AK830_g3627 [Neonectria ditissima]